MDLVNLITSWPVIIQGALGSALFALSLYVGQSITRLISNRLQKDKETAEFFAIMAWTRIEPYKERSKRGFLICLYAAMHYLIKALIVFLIALSISPFISVFSIVGYALAIYFLFRGLSYVPHRESLGDVDEKYEKALAEVTNKQKQADA